MSNIITLPALGDKFQKPASWNLNSALVDPEWEWFYRRGIEGIKIFHPTWEGGGAPRDVIGQNHGTLGNTPPAWKGGRAGLTLEYDDSVDQENNWYTVADGSDLTFPAGNWTLAWYMSIPDSSGVAFQYFHSWGGAGVNPSINVFEIESTGVFKAILNSGADLSPITSSIAPFSGYKLIVLRKFAANEARFYIDGVQNHASYDGQNSLGEVNRSDALNIGRRSDASTTRYFGGDLSWWAKWDRDIGEAAIAQLAANPFGPFRMSSMYFVSAALPPSTGTGALIFNPFSVVAAGAMQPEGTSTPTLEEMVLAAVGEQPHEGVGALTMTAEDLVAVGAMEPEGVGALTMTAEDLVAVGEQSSVLASDVKVAVVSKLLNLTVGGDTDFTKPDFGTPKACIVLVTGDATDDTSVQAQSRQSIGFSDFTNDFCITHQDEDASAKVDCDALKSATRCYSILDVGASEIVSGTASTITDGVRLTHTTGQGSALRATVIMIGGADPVDDLRSTTINSSQDGTATITHSGLTDGNDKLIFFIGTDISAEDSASSGITSSFGVCHVSGNDAGGHTFVQRCMGWASDHNNNVGSPSAIISTDRVLDILTETAGQDWGLEVTSFSSSGGTITVTTRDAGAGAGMEVYSLVIDLDDLKGKVFSVDSPTSGATWAVTGSGFKPQYVGLGLTHLTAEDTIASDANSGALGISSNTGGGEETCHSWYNEDAAAITNTNNLFRSRVIDFRDDDVTTVIQDHSHLSFDSDGFTTTINAENEATARKLFGWAIEEAVATAPSGSSDPTLEPLTIIAAGIMEADGVGVLTMTAEDLVAVGEQPHEGVGAPTMIAEDLVAVGEQPHEGAGALTMTAEDLVAVGAQSEPEGVGDLTMQPETMTATGVMQPEGTSTPTLEAMVLAAVGQVPFEGVGTMNFQELILNAVGSVPVEGVGVPTLEALAMVAVGVMGAEGTGSPDLQDLVMTAAGVQKFLGTSLPTLEAMTLVTAGEMLSSGTGTPELQDMVLAAQGVEKFLGTGVLTLEVMALAAVGAMQPDGTGAPALEDLILATQGEQPHEGTGAPTLQDMVLAAVGVHGAPEGIGALIMAAQELVAQGHENPDGVGALDLAAEELIAQGQMPSEGVGAVTLQDFLLTAAGAQAGAGLSRAFKMLLRPRRRPGQGRGK